MRDKFAKKSVLLPLWLWEQVSDYQSIHGCRTQSEALRRILTERFGGQKQANGARLPAGTAP